MVLDFVNDIMKQNSIFKEEFYSLIEKLRKICKCENIQVRVHSDGSYIIELDSEEKQ